MLVQSRPLVIPSAALLDRANCWQLLPPLEEFIFAATAATQLLNDLADLYRDREVASEPGQSKLLLNSRAIALGMIFST